MSINETVLGLCLFGCGSPLLKPSVQVPMHHGKVWQGQGLMLGLSQGLAFSNAGYQC